MRKLWYVKIIVTVLLLTTSSLVIAIPGGGENIGTLLSGIQYMADHPASYDGNEIMTNLARKGQKYTSASVLDKQTEYLFMLDVAATREAWYLQLGTCGLRMLKMWSLHDGIMVEQKPVFTTRVDQVLLMQPMPSGGKVILAVQFTSSPSPYIHGYLQTDLDPYRDLIWVVLNIVIIGACLGIVVYCATFFRVIGMRNTILFMLYAMSLILFCIIASGVAKVLNLPVYVNAVMAPLMVLSTIFGSVFVINFFRMREYLPKLRHTLIVVCALSSLCIVLDMSGVPLPMSLEVYTRIVYGLLFLSSVFAAWVARHDKLEGIVFYIAAWAVAGACFLLARGGGHFHLDEPVSFSVILHFGILMLIAITCYAFSSRVQAQSKQLFKYVEDSNMVLLKRIEDRSQTIKNQQRELVEAGKLASLGEIIAGISHEVNNPLAIILGYTGQLKSLLGKQIMHSRFINEMLPAIENSVERIRLIIHQLNAFSGLYTQEKSIYQKLSPLINNAIHNQNERIVSQICRIEVPAYLADVEVYGKTDYLKQIFDIMLANALDATVNATAKWIRIDTVTTREHLLIRFSNSGTVIASEKMAGSRPDTGKMTAIGLVIARRLAEDQNIELYMDRDEQQSFLILKLPR